MKRGQEGYLFRKYLPLLVAARAPETQGSPLFYSAINNHSINVASAGWNYSFSFKIKNYFFSWNRKSERHFLIAEIRHRNSFSHCKCYKSIYFKISDPQTLFGLQKVKKLKIIDSMMQFIERRKTVTQFLWHSAVLHVGSVTYCCIIILQDRSDFLWVCYIISLWLYGGGPTIPQLKHSRQYSQKILPSSINYTICYNLEM